MFAMILVVEQEACGMGFGPYGLDHGDVAW